MSNVLAASSLELDHINNLLGKDIPSYRKAYSDRTAWLMACVSELVYIRFNPLFSKSQSKDYFLDHVNKLLNKANNDISDNKLKILNKLIDTVAYDHEAEEQKLKGELNLIQMELVEKFDEDGTQAIIVSFNEFLVLAFRGTEATSKKDIKSDVNAITKVCESGGKIHSGFDEAYSNVAIDIQKTLEQDKYSNKPVFITGHSLGGALATVAAKKLNHKGGISACYTFGSPRVGNEDWIENIKAPVYRVVNAADGVTMMPPSSEAITGFSFIIKYVPYVGPTIRKILLSKFAGYMHGGNMRYLTGCLPGKYEDVKLLYSVSFFRRVMGIKKNDLPWKNFLADHSISLYRKKLMHVASNRNK